METKAIIFDVDGTIADTEKWGHLPACNDAFVSIGLDVCWDWETFRKLIGSVSGNAERLRYFLTTHYDYSRDKVETIVKQFIPLKKKIYIEKYAANVELRGCVVKFIEESLSAGLRLAVVTASHEEQVHALFNNKLVEYKKHFDPILGRESGKKTGEDGVLYERCLEQMKLKAKECLVIEDSEAGLKAAMKAGIPTVVCYNDYTKHENFDGALLVSDSIANVNLHELILSV